MRSLPKFLMFYAFLLACILQLNAQDSTGDYISDQTMISDGISSPGSMGMDANDQLFADDIGTGNSYKVAPI